jgi:hypothetical protein
VDADGCAFGIVRATETKKAKEKKKAMSRGHPPGDPVSFSVRFSFLFPLFPFPLHPHTATTATTDNTRTA